MNHFKGEVAHKRLIMSRHKNLNDYDYLLNDRNKIGADSFSGERIHFWIERFPD